MPRWLPLLPVAVTGSFPFLRTRLYTTRFTFTALFWLVRYTTFYALLHVPVVRTVLYMCVVTLVTFVTAVTGWFVTHAVLGGCAHAFVHTRFAGLVFAAHCTAFCAPLRLHTISAVTHTPVTLLLRFTHVAVAAHYNVVHTLLRFWIVHATVCHTAAFCRCLYTGSVPRVPLRLRLVRLRLFTRVVPTPYWLRSYTRLHGSFSSGWFTPFGSGCVTGYYLLPTVTVTPILPFTHAHISHTRSASSHTLVLTLLYGSVTPAVPAIRTCTLLPHLPDCLPLRSCLWVLPAPLLPPLRVRYAVGYPFGSDFGLLPTVLPGCAYRLPCHYRFFCLTPAHTHLPLRYRMPGSTRLHTHVRYTVYTHTCAHVAFTYATHALGYAFTRLPFAGLLHRFTVVVLVRTHAGSDFGSRFYLWIGYTRSHALPHAARGYGSRCGLDYFAVLLRLHMQLLPPPATAYHARCRTPTVTVHHADYHALRCGLPRFGYRFRFAGSPHTLCPTVATHLPRMPRCCTPAPFTTRLPTLHCWLVLGCAYTYTRTFIYHYRAVLPRCIRTFTI